MNRFGMWFSNMMRGRYGTDNLNRFLLIVTIIVIVVNMFLGWRILSYVVVALLIYVYCRMFSRNVNARYRENQKFLQLTSKFSRAGHRASGYGNQGYGSQGGYSYGSQGGYGSQNGFNAKRGFGAKRDKTHKILRCPVCGEKLRVPKGAGKINISCPHCGNKFVKKV